VGCCGPGTVPGFSVKGGQFLIWVFKSFLLQADPWTSVHTYTDLIDSNNNYPENKQKSAKGRRNWLTADE
jgi:hypothetical protein